MVKGRCGGGRRHGLDGNHRGRKEDWAILWGWVGKMSYQSDKEWKVCRRWARDCRQGADTGTFSLFSMYKFWVNFQYANWVPLPCEIFDFSSMLWIANILQFLPHHVISHIGPSFALSIAFFSRLCTNESEVWHARPLTIFSWPKIELYVLAQCPPHSQNRAQSIWSKDHLWKSGIHA